VERDTPCRPIQWFPPRGPRKQLLQLVVAANIPVLPTDLDGAAPGDFGDLFRGPTNGTPIVPAYLELSFPSAALPNRRYARELYAQLAVVGQSICVMGFSSDVISSGRARWDQSLYI
jgi:hypothetical protein